MEMKFQYGEECNMTGKRVRILCDNIPGTNIPVTERFPNRLAVIDRNVREDGKNSRIWFVYRDENHCGSRRITFLFHERDFEIVTKEETSTIVTTCPECGHKVVDYPWITEHKNDANITRTCYDCGKTSTINKWFNTDKIGKCKSIW